MLNVSLILFYNPFLSFFITTRSLNCNFVNWAGLPANPYGGSDPIVSIFLGRANYSELCLTKYSKAVDRSELRFLHWRLTNRFKFFIKSLSAFLQTLRLNKQIIEHGIKHIQKPVCFPIFNINYFAGI